MDIIIIGSGPAGVSAALYAKRAGADVTVITRGSGALAKAEKIENYYGLAEPLTGAELEANGIAGAKRLGVSFIEDEVVGLAMNDDFTGLIVQTPGRACEAKAVVLTAGSTRLAPKIPGLKELEGKGVSYCAICDAFFYRQKTVAVLGEGDYALHEAEILLPHASKVMLFTNGKEPAVKMQAQVRQRSPHSSPRWTALSAIRQSRYSFLPRRISMLNREARKALTPR